MPLQSELHAFKAAWLQRVGAETAGLVDDDIAALRALADRALKAGAQFPAMTLPDQNSRPVNLAELCADRPLVVTFYRGGWCPYCNLELRAYQKLLPSIVAQGARLVAVSPETPDNTLSTAEKNALEFDVLSDRQGQLAEALGIRFALSPAIKALYQKFGHDLSARNADDTWSLPMPASYVVAKGGRIVLAKVDPDYRTRLDPGAALAALQGLADATAA